MPSWNDGPAKQAILDFVRETTETGSAKFVPPEERIPPSIRFLDGRHGCDHAAFEKFVKATGYVTVAERAPTKEEFPTAPPESLVADSSVFSPTSARCR
ncbi:MAG TPA: hypothetical protein VFS35_10490 [Terrimicrobiaceae bacterium]|nr:hypothetical protein [Terrimicrobiaceae bacterium]